MTESGDDSVQQPRMSNIWGAGSAAVELSVIISNNAILEKHYT